MSLQWTEQDVFVGPEGREQLVGVRAAATDAEHGIEWEASYSVARMALEVRARVQAGNWARARGAWYSFTSNSVWEFLCRGNAQAELAVRHWYRAAEFVEDFHARMDERFATDTEPFGAPPVALNRMEEP